MCVRPRVVQGMSLSSFVCYTYESRTSLETTAQSKEVIYWLEILINASKTSSPTLDKTAGRGERLKTWGYQARPPGAMAVFISLSACAFSLEMKTHA
jgi:hypothetical protein